jgi:hypothetical protein
VRKNKKDSKELAREAARWTQAFVTALSKAPPAQLPELQNNIEEITRCVLSPLCRIALTVDECRALDAIVVSTKQRTKKNVLTAAFHKAKDAEEIQRDRDQLKGAFDRFVVRVRSCFEICSAPCINRRLRTSDLTSPSPASRRLWLASIWPCLTSPPPNHARRNRLSHLSRTLIEVRQSTGGCSGHNLTPKLC